LEKEVINGGINMYEYKCKVKRVVDGDTMDVVLDLGFDILHACRVRLAGIDTPESRTRDLDEKARGKLSKAYLKESIKGKKIVLKTKLKDSKGKFGRVIAEVWAEFEEGSLRNVNELMVKEAYAVVYNAENKALVEEAHMANRAILIEKGLFVPVEK
jgi:micrococcal nuclease|tara:strand:- start:2390 stop:2860 length:471 start_codon:yes stop_codon:yes gene_type:complete